MSKELPHFRYHPNPIKSRVIVQREATCPVCHEHTSYVYEGGVYGGFDAENICPWCIENGNASRLLNAHIIDGTLCERVQDPERQEELENRTPSYCGWQREQWPVHCDDYCAFVDYVGWEEIRHLANELEPDMFEWGGRVMVAASLKNEGSMQGYLFRCLHCGKPRLVIDCDETRAMKSPLHDLMLADT